ncbi:MAG TPA: hydroxysqualene dehydroxylase HpnE [Verrucomicrobiae bacterium]|jgi:squalene-associated FAD-dependent desaturase|nr:hydroxysqualene dehydroxylase HpnE [Verrucomicrobiae bacterium]
MTDSSQSKTVAVIGGGLAGLAAGCALADAGMRVTLLERRPYVGGRASSYEHPGTGEVVDNCQHVLLGCCTNLVHFYRQLGASDKIRWFDELVFMEPGGKSSTIKPSFLPAPFHSMRSFLTASMLSVRDKLAIARAFMAITRGRLPEDSSEDFQQWLLRHGQTHRAIEHFWKVVLVSALNEDLDRISVPYAFQVFRESFLKSAAAGRMGLPKVPLSDLYSTAMDYIRARGGQVLLRSSVTAVDPRQTNVLVRSNTSAQEFDFVVLAAPFQNAAALLPQDALATPLKEDLEHFAASPITGIHLWFDREITALPHAVLLDRTIQWMFQKSKFLENDSARKAGQGSYVELVVSASKSLVQKSREEVLELGLRELADFFPVVKESKLVKAAVIKEVYATYSILPGLDQYRPEAKTPWPNIFLAGDWTASGWPATMEGAVRSGYQAAEALTLSAGIPRKFLVADLPPSGLMKFI